MAEKDLLDSNLEMDFQVPEFLSANSNLKPQLDDIFAEVEKSLPDIDFDASDVSTVYRELNYFIDSILILYLRSCDNLLTYSY